MGLRYDLSQDRAVLLTATMLEMGWALSLESITCSSIFDRNGLKMGMKFVKVGVQVF